MENRLTRILSSLRGRPAHERRILAIATYAASAAVILALWTVSFRALLSPELPQEPEALGPRASREATQTPPPPELTSPFGTIRGSLRAAGSGIRDIAVQLRNLSASGGGSEPPAPRLADSPQERGGGAPPREPVQAKAEAPATIPETAVRPKPESRNPSAALGLIANPEREAGSRLALLLAPRRTPQENTPEAPLFRTLLTEGFGKFRRAAGEFIRIFDTR